jgi:hypothetical protein
VAITGPLVVVAVASGIVVVLVTSTLSGVACSLCAQPAAVSASPATAEIASLSFGLRRGGREVEDECTVLT